eukprot:1129854-Ditylum_brightwellii.AAC.1
MKFTWKLRASQMSFSHFMSPAFLCPHCRIPAPCSQPRASTFIEDIGEGVKYLPKIACGYDISTCSINPFCQSSSHMNSKLKTTLHT